jgi:hypothetical protein
MVADDFACLITLRGSRRSNTTSGALGRAAASAGAFMRTQTNIQPNVTHMANRSSARVLRAVRATQWSNTAGASGRTPQG